MGQREAVPAIEQAYAALRSMRADVELMVRQEDELAVLLDQFLVVVERYRLCPRCGERQPAAAVRCADCGGAIESGPATGESLPTL